MFRLAHLSDPHVSPLPRARVVAPPALPSCTDVERADTELPAVLDPWQASSGEQSWILSQA